MINFTVSPVTLNQNILEMGSKQMPYFRTPEFSESIFENEKIIKKFVGANDSSRVCFITGSGTASMEAAVINVFSEKDKILVIDPGEFSFGHRFTEILKTYNLRYEILKPEFGKNITEEQLIKFENKGFTGLLINHCETSIGVLYDINMIGNFCKRNNIMLVVDCISSFLCDSIDMQNDNIDVVISTSSKALACPPGISIIVLSEKSIERVLNNHPKTFYFDLKKYIENGDRGQTPFTPAVSILCQINRRLKDIKDSKKEINRVNKLATYFRQKIKEYDLPFEIISNNLSNCVTPLSPINNISAFWIYEFLRKEYDIFVNPNGGMLADKIFRVGHIGDIKESQIDFLISIFCILKKQGKI